MSKQTPAKYVLQKQRGTQTQKHAQHAVQYTLACLLLTPYPINGNDSHQQGLQGSHRVVCHRANAFIWVGGTSVCVRAGGRACMRACVCLLQGLLLAPAAECLCFLLPCPHPHSLLYLTAKARAHTYLSICVGSNPICPLSNLSLCELFSVT